MVLLVLYGPLASIFSEQQRQNQMLERTSSKGPLDRTPSMERTSSKGPLDKTPSSGYGGHVPGVRSENLHGGNTSEMARLASLSRDLETQRRVGADLEER